MLGSVTPGTFVTISCGFSYEFAGGISSSMLDEDSQVTLCVRPQPRTVERNPLQSNPDAGRPLPRSENAPETLAPESSAFLIRASFGFRARPWDLAPCHGDCPLSSLLSAASISAHDGTRQRRKVLPSLESSASALGRKRRPVTMCRCPFGTRTSPLSRRLCAPWTDRDFS